MNTAAPASLLSTTARFVVASVAVVALAGAWVAAGTASHVAVGNAYAAVNTTRVTLPAVEVVAQREYTVKVAGQSVAKFAY
jgi:hypothetical protein